MNEARRHPDLFTPEEAAAYLCVEVAQLPTLKKDFGLLGHSVGKATVYWRKDLDAAAFKIVGLRVPAELTRPMELRVAR